jgi:hypothetical protein
MQVFNTHRREVSAPVDEVGSLIDGLASRADRLWPYADWPPMRFDPPGISAGAVGGHGPVGYRVEHHEPRRSVTFRFTGTAGLTGRHQYIVQATGADSCVLWHLTDITLHGMLRLSWFTFWAPLHNALVEDSLDRAQALEGTGGARVVARRSRWSLYVRGLRALGSGLSIVSGDHPRTSESHRAPTAEGRGSSLPTARS